MDSQTVFALDIETDGLVKPIPTSLVLADEKHIRAVVRENGEHHIGDEELYHQLRDNFDMDYTLHTTVASSWEDMADEIECVLDDADVGNSDLLTTYNGLGYRSGFDFPVLDYAYHTVGGGVPFRGHEHVDVYDVVNRIYSTTPQFPKRGGPKKGEMQDAAAMFGLEDEASGLNKAPLADLLNDELTPEQMQEWADSNGCDVPTTDVEGLDEVYDYLYPDQPLPDPFEDSSACVDAWENGWYEDLLIHNISDTLKTLRLYDYVEKSSIPYRHYTSDRLG